MKAPPPLSQEASVLDPKTHEQGAAFDRIMSRAVREAQAESRRQGVPNVYSIGGVIHYEQPDGSLATTDPFDKQGAATPSRSNAL